MNVLRHSVFHTQKTNYRAGEASGSSISNGCQAKTERPRQRAGVGTEKGGTQDHAKVTGSHITAFLATVVPLEPYFTDNPHTVKVLILGVICK